MYEPEAVYTLVGLIRAGLLDLSHYAVTEFTLSEINHAITHAAENSCNDSQSKPLQLAISADFDPH